MASEIRIHSAGYPEIVGELAGDDIEPTFRFTAGLRKQLAPAERRLLTLYPTWGARESGPRAIPRPALDRSAARC